MERKEWEIELINRIEKIDREGGNKGEIKGQDVEGQASSRIAQSLPHCAWQVK